MIRADEPHWTFPRVDPDATALDAAALGHPLIPAERRVANDVQVGPRGTLLLITGSNMSGKSTLLRAIGLNTVLAQAGAPVCATGFSMPPVDLQTSIRVQDSLELGLSYFMAALARLKQIVDAAERGAGPQRVLMYLLDEVLQGTNSVERGLAVRAVVRHLLDAGAIGVMTTHDLALAGRGAAAVRCPPRALHRAGPSRRAHVVRLPAATGPRDLDQRAAADAADRHRPVMSRYAILALVLLVTTAAAQPARYDLVVAGGTVIDGTGAPRAGRTSRSRTAGSPRSARSRTRRARGHRRIRPRRRARIHRRPHARRQPRRRVPRPPTSCAWASPRSSPATAGRRRSTSARRSPRCASTARRRQLRDADRAQHRAAARSWDRRTRDADDGRARRG